MHEVTSLAAFEHNGQPVARQRFYEIACDPQRSVAVEACAGAGKTWMLVSRMVRALWAGVLPQEILAITFTKKAAGEMRERLHALLLGFATKTNAELVSELRMRGVTGDISVAQLETLRQLHVQLLRHGRSVQIRTFHSWFAALLRSAPLAVLDALGLPSTYELLESDTQAIAQVWRRFHQRVAHDPAARADYCDAVKSFGRHQTQKALEATLAKRVEFALADAHGVVHASVLHFSVQFPAFSGLENPEDRVRSSAIQQLLCSAARTLGAGAGVKVAEAAQALERALTEGHVAGIFDALLTKTGSARKFSEKLQGLEVVQQAQSILLETLQAQHQHQSWLHQQRMTRLARGILADYANLKRERAWVDMGDLERGALTLMSNPVLSGWVQERLDARVRHLLIDEFQDTNPLQWQALSAWLSGYAGAGSAPSVFLVGDPKQSIYRFRRAEPQVFKAAQAFVRNGLGGDLLSCDHTRRNAPVVIDLVNKVMLQAQAQALFEGFRAHTTESTEAGHILALPRIERAEKEVAQHEVDAEWVWRESLRTPRQLREETRKTLECRQAAQWVAQYLQTAGSALGPGKIMVLARKRERLGLMQAELAALGIAAQQPEKNDLIDMPEVQDIVALMDVLVSPVHDLSLARVLKSPLFSVSDADLVQLVVRLREKQVNAGTRSWWHTLHADQDWPEALGQAAQRLLVWQQWVQHLSVHDALSAIYEDGDVVARFAAASLPQLRSRTLANLHALLAAALQFDGGRYVNMYAFVRALLAGGMAAPVRADADAVRLLTVHGAKGLEAPLVLLLDTDGESTKAETMGVLLNWPGQDAFPQKFVFLASESNPPACAAQALAQERAARQREELNGLYVALTRSQQTIVLSSLAPHIPNPHSWWQQLHPHAQPVEPLVPAVMTSAEQGLESHQFALRELPSLPPTQQLQSPEGSSNVLASEESRIGQTMHRLLEWMQIKSATIPMQIWSDAQRSAVTKEFALNAAQLDEACARAQRILQGEGAWAWDATQLQWHGNEVTMTHQGRVVRMDRLVQHCDGTWWILDYKSTDNPQLQPSLCAQLEAYRSAVSQVYPDQPVRAAFLTAHGALIEMKES